MTIAPESSLPVAGTKPAAGAALWLACCAAFVASFCMLVIEIVAARIMAPYVGVSLYTWTSIIGVILAGISIGAWAGGIVADRRPRSSTLAWLFLIAGICALFIAPLADAIGASESLERIAPTLLTRVLLIAVLLFFLPAFLLGMISPVTVKLALASLDTSGGIVGKIYAFSTLGSIAGTFATGFVLIAWLGTRTVLLSVAIALLLSSLLFSGALRRIPALLAIAVFGGALGFAGPNRLLEMYHEHVDPIAYGDYYFAESNYYTIRLRQLERPDHRFIEVLLLDHLVHSFTDLHDPSDLHYGYLRSFDDVVRWKLRRNPAPRLLFLGGGGYTLPRYIAASIPRASIDVVEIDPAVTRVATEYLGADPQRIHTINTDARWYVMTTHRRYDAIFCDAFNDLSIPFHLTTREFDAELERLLRPGGFVAANVIDNYQRGEFLPAYLKTVRSVFGQDNVALMADWPSTVVDMQATFVVVATPDRRELVSFIGSQPGNPVTSIVRPPALSAWLHTRHAPLLTDDYAPVDNLLAPLFEQRYRYRAE